MAIPPRLFGHAMVLMTLGGPEMLEFAKLKAAAGEAAIAISPHILLFPPRTQHC